MPLFENDARIFSRRNLILGGLQGGVFLALAGRLQYLQVSQTETYSTLAEANRISITELSAARGRVLDRHGRLLAENNRKLQVQFVPEQTENIGKTLASLQQILQLTDSDIREIERRMRRTPNFKAITVADDVDWERFSALTLNLPFLPGVQPRIGEKRVYPYGEVAAHLIGYVGTKTHEDILRIGNIVGDVVGRSGVEREFELALRGSPGIRQVEVNAYGRTVRELRSRAGKPGDDLNLSIDVELHKFVTERMKGYSGSVIVMDVENGELLSLVSTPAFDPNAFSLGIDPLVWDNLLQHERKPLVNKALRGQYAPGSTFKMLVALAALEDGLIEPEDKITCTGLYRFAGEEFHCWRSRGHGATNMVQALERSCDTYFYDLSLRVGIDRIEAMARRFGFGQETGVNLSGEKPGIVPGRDWKRANYDTGWRTGETIITGIGQGYLLATPLQLTVMTAALANGGKIVKPRITRDGDEDDSADIGIDPTNLSIVQHGLYSAVNQSTGTAHASSLLVDGQRMAGKTGTVQVRRISKAERKGGVIPNAKLDWHLRDHALFVGYVPHDKPRHAISVVVEHGGGGARIAAPIARDIMIHLLRSLPPAATPSASDAAGDAASRLDETSEGAL